MIYEVQVKYPSRPHHNLNLIRFLKIAYFPWSMGRGVVLLNHEISLKNCPSPGKEILALNVNVILLVDHAIHHHQRGCVGCMESTPYHEDLSRYLEQYTTAAKGLWTVQTATRRLVHLISSTLILGANWDPFPLMIDRRARSSLGVAILNLGPLGLYSLRRRRLISIGIPFINRRRSSDRLRFTMGIPIPVRRRLLSE